MKEKKLFILIFIFGLVMVFIGVTYSFFTYDQEGIRNSELIAGEVYMHYLESNELTLDNVMPQKSLPYSFQDYYTLNQDATPVNITACANYLTNQVGPEEYELNAGETWSAYCSGTGTMWGDTLIESITFFSEEEKQELIDLNIIKVENDSEMLNNYSYFEFTVDGKNTVPDKDIWYQIDLNHGDNHATRTERIRDDLLRFRLVEVINEEEKVLISDRAYSNLTNQKMWVDTIDRNTTNEITKTYRLYMWISNNINVCAGDIATGCDYYMSNSPNWNNVYASIKVNVSGDFNEKTLSYNYMAGIGNESYYVEYDPFWALPIHKIDYVTEVNFVNLSQSEINQRYQAAYFKEDMTDSTKNGNSVLMWLEEDDLSNYKMYVASDGITVFPEDCSDMFSNFNNLTSINFENIDTSQITSMNLMFSDCRRLTNLNLSNFDTSQVTDMSAMFSGCISLTSLNLSNFDTSKVTNMMCMFYGCSSLTSLNLSNFDTSQVTDMNHMFCQTDRLINLDISHFDTSNLFDESEMFLCNIK